MVKSLVKNPLKIGMILGARLWSRFEFRWASRGIGTQSATVSPVPEAPARRIALVKHEGVRAPREWYRNDTRWGSHGSQGHNGGPV